MSMAERLNDAWNSHVAESVARLFAEDYQSGQPNHPGREFVGRSQVLANWSAVFDGVPDFAAALVGWALDGDTEWAEWDWSGVHTDGTPFSMRGVTILTVRHGLISSARLYMEPVDVSGDDIDASVKQLYKASDRPDHEG
jgi:ketosteroid isomerase-like protein